MRIRSFTLFRGIVSSVEGCESKNSDRSPSPQIHARMLAESYSPRTWRTQPLHLLPPDSITSLKDPRALPTLNWIFLVSSLNFSFWSELDEHARFGVDWRAGWDKNSEPARWTGYWSLPAALDRGWLYCSNRKCLQMRHENTKFSAAISLSYSTGLQLSMKGYQSQTPTFTRPQPNVQIL